ncbi:MAG: peptidase M48 [Deltaproteobacteria bacterium HGW-Deltaproteobacteria-18]|nr:MAG: peptidase M48 [Deltaproteobacteria bacterium HGW-Deltaproteobacteria-18]
MTFFQGARMRVFAFTCLIALVFPCSTFSSFGEFTIRDELELARKFDLVIETRFPVIHDTRITGYVSSLVDRLIAAMPPQPFPIKTTVVSNQALNAFASAAGHITVFTGLIANLETEDELASVIAHELAHVSERHIANSIEKSKLVGAGSLLGILAGVLVGSQGGGDGAGALVLGSVAGAKAMQLKYTRENEKDADQYGLGYLVDAGFAPAGMTSAFNKIRKLQWLGGGGDVPSYLSTHPGMDDRVVYMQERMARLPANVRNRASDNTDFERVKLLVQAWYTDPNTARAIFTSSEKSTCPAVLGEAITLSRLQQIEAASARFEDAMACNGRDPLWMREYGRFSFEYGDLETAAKYLQEVVLRDPKDLFALFFYARAVAEQGKHAASVSAMERVLKAVPRDAEVLEYLARYQAALGRAFDAHLNYAKSFAYKRKFSKYNFHLQKSEALAQTPPQQEQLRKVREEIAEFREILGI